MERKEDSFERAGPKEGGRVEDEGAGCAVNEPGRGRSLEADPRESTARRARKSTSSGGGNEMRRLFGNSSPFLLATEPRTIVAYALRDCGVTVV